MQFVFLSFLLMHLRANCAIVNSIHALPCVLSMLHVFQSERREKREVEGEAEEEREILVNLWILCARLSLFVGLCRYHTLRSSPQRDKKLLGSLLLVV